MNKFRESYGHGGRGSGGLVCLSLCGYGHQCSCTFAAK